MAGKPPDIWSRPMPARPLRRLLRAIAIAATLGVVGACVDDPAVGSGLTGDIAIDGSSTVAPLTEAVAEEYRLEESRVRVAVGTSGTGGGFERFCRGEIDISDASRPIKDEEREACRSGGIEFVELRVGLDGLAVVTSERNEFLECLSLEQLSKIWAEPGARDWSDVDQSFPDRRIAIFGPDAESGTYDFFNEEVLGDPKDPAVPKAITRYTASADDNVLVTGISGEENSFGFFGFAYFQENEDDLKALEVSEEGGACVPITAETIASGEYPLSRPLFIYVNTESLAKPHVAAFVEFYLQVTPEIIREVGYVVAPAEDYAAGMASIGSANGS